MTTSSAGPRLLGPAEVRQLAAELELRPTKQRGQNFVIDPNTVRRIVRESRITDSDVVLEVGPGLGSLTLALLEVARRVVAIEVDPVLADRLPATIATFAPHQAANFEVILADALRVEELPGSPPTALVANLPYNVSVPVLLHLMELLPSLERGLVMVQAEVADQQQRQLELLVERSYRRGIVDRTAQRTATRERVFAVIDAAFAHRRKQVRGALRELAGSAEAATRALAYAGVDPAARGEVLSIQDFARIAEGLDQ